MLRHTYTQYNTTRTSGIENCYYKHNLVYHQVSVPNILRSLPTITISIQTKCCIHGTSMVQNTEHFSIYAECLLFQISKTVLYNSIEEDEGTGFPPGDIWRFVNVLVIQIRNLGRKREGKSVHPKKGESPHLAGV